ncbi:zinc ribbon domain-containing protein [Pseudobutyrivibrio ruminis]|nr:zinc ribbon domain-containing protein [Pseudobutyrivibrio ruminis]
MRCPSCNAEIEANSKVCQYCGTQISYDMKREQEQLNKVGCPKCGSSNITFEREKQGEVKGKNGSTVVRRTVGLCKDCGYTWYSDGQQREYKKKSSTWLWVLGWIFMFPVPLTILMVRNKNMKPVVKGLIIAAAWIVYFCIGLSGNSETEDGTPGTSIEVTQEDVGNM